MATIKKIKEKLALIRQLNDPFFAELEKDGRSGVIQAVAKRKKRDSKDPR